MSSRHHLPYYLKVGIRGIFVHGFSSLSAVWSITACLIIAGISILLSLTLADTITDLGQSGDICAYVDETLSDNDAAALSASFSDIPNIRTVDFIDRSENLANLREKLGTESSVLDGLESDNPLRSYYRIWVVGLESYTQTVDAIRQVFGIADVYAPIDTVLFLMRVRTILLYISAAFLVMFGLLSVSQISNTLKLIANDRRDEIAIMKMIGATNFFIRAPLFIESFILSVFSACIAFAFQWFLGNYLLSSVLGSLGLFSIADINQYLIFFAAGDLAFSLILGIVGSIRPIRKYLRV